MFSRDTLRAALILPALGLLAVFSFLLAGPGDQNGKGGANRHGAGVEPAVTPDYPYNVWLCRPGADNFTVSVIAWQPLSGFVTFGDSPEALKNRTEVTNWNPSDVKNLLVSGLKPDQTVYYQFNYKIGKAEAFQKDPVRSCHTQRKPSSTFTFAIQADSHLDVATDLKVYQRTLANMGADHPDFMIDLGDTTMVDKFGREFTKSESQYRAQRYLLGSIAHSIPMLMVLGNHDGEDGSRLDGPNSMPVWSVGMRKRFFPNPETGGIYTGNVKPEPQAGLLQDYYAFEWGAALFVVLDPFWYSREGRSRDQWAPTLGVDQYRWLTGVLEKSKAKQKFIFIHHLVGGLSHDVRGGVHAAPYMEWGGKNEDGSEGFAKHRPGWALPLHALFVKNGVTAVFHGHDHLYVKEQLDGIIYQEVPQPSHPTGGTRSAEDYGYKGVVLGSSGHLRITVDEKQAKVDYVRAGVPGVTRDNVVNGSVEYSYTIPAK